MLRDVPKIFQTEHLKCLNHSPTSAKRLHEKYGFFANGKEMPHEVEQYLFDAFIEDDYDGALHLTTLHFVKTPSPNNVIQCNDRIIDVHSSTDQSECPPVGLVFWREVPDEEMKEWFDWKHVAEALGRYSVDSASPIKMKAQTSHPRGNRALTFMRQKSLDSIQSMVKNLHVSSSALAKPEDLLSNFELVKDDMSHAWIKLELIAVRQQFWGKHLGSLLLSCALYHAHSKYDQSRVILHVAGGEENIPAKRLYDRFGFLPVRQKTIFQKPDRHLYVLGDIARSLAGITWSKGVLEHVENDGE